MSNVQTDKKLTGAAMVVGGGISGMQSALDLAESGFKVYLLDEKPAIGGTMARLDKTFPTNDCAMCIMSPKLVDTGRHKNIEIITGAKVKAVTGEPGNFKVTVQQKARYVDIPKCTGCGDCARVCPVELPNEFNGEIDTRKATYKLYAQATPNAFAIDKRGVAPCKATCPAGINVQGYVQLIKSGKFIDAWKMIYEEMPFPAICGRICAHPCQTACNRAKVDEPIQIATLKRLAADVAYQQDINELPLPKKEAERDEKVAVIGSGPAGLAAAHFLALKGYQVTIFEAQPVTGGMMRIGIPEYRLPKKWVDLEIDLIKRLGVEIKVNTALGKDITIDGLLKDGFKAIFLGVGCQKGTSMRTPGEDMEGVISAVDMLRRIGLGEKVEVGKKVLVVGGGNVAMDAARSARRAGAEVHVLYRRTRGEMPAAQEEVEEAMEEGVQFHFRTLIKEIKGNGKITGCSTIEVVRMEKNDKGKWVPVYGDTITEWTDVDTIISAIGQTADLSFAGDKPLTNEWGDRIVADPDTLATNVPGIFTGGDVFTGPALLIDAVGAGKRAAESIHRYIQGEDLRAGREFKMPEDKISPIPRKAESYTRQPRVKQSHAPAERRAANTEEVCLGFTPEQAQEEAARCLNCAICSECMQCVEACLPKAIDHSMQDKEFEIEVGAMVMNPGFKPYDPEELKLYGYGKLPNVVTSIQFERILSASGPFAGHMVRPSDHKEPVKIAWIQCVGSRNERIGKGYCSSVCCMYAIKQAIIAKEHSHDPLEAKLFYMDMRTPGKDFERYLNRAKEEHGVQFIRSRIYGIDPVPGSDDVMMRYADEEGNIYHETFDMVVLSIGLSAPEGAKELGAATGIELDKYGFCRAETFSPVCSSREGIYVSGAFGEPKDIPETAVDASAAAAMVSRLLAPARGTMTTVQEFPPEKDVTNQLPRVGVFVCNCGINIGSVVRVPEVAEFAKTLPGVVHTEEFLFSCSQDNIIKIKERIGEHNLNRVVVASCTPRTHAPLFQSSMKDAGLNPYLYEHANIREQSSWVHREEPEDATEKAKDLVKMAVAKVRLLKPVQTAFIDVNQRALVVGGGVAGMTNALSLAEQGYAVTLVEKADSLGGRATELRYSLKGEDIPAFVAKLKADVEANSFIDIVLNAQVAEVAGYLGNYRTTLIKENGDKVEVEHGAVIIATGADEIVPESYLYGSSPAVVTQTQLEQKLADQGLGHAKTVVMINCVGSREPERPYCSRVCCTHAIKNALKVKELNPEANVVVLYRDIRTYGFKEEYYTEARRKGVIFIRYSVDDKPQVAANGDKVTVTVTDHVLKQPIKIEADILALANGIKPRPDTEALSQLFKVPLNADGFYLEAHMKLRPVDFAADGLYLCGLAHGPKTVGETIAQANAASVRAVTLLSKGRLESLGITAEVDLELCKGCGICTTACAYGARVYDERRGVAYVREVLCQGCGACVAACPSGATQQKGFEKEQLLAMMDAALG